MLIRKINALIWFRWMKKKTSSLIEDKIKDKAQRAYTCRNPKRHILLVSLLFWHKMAAVRCFVWPLALRLWSVNEVTITCHRLLCHILHGPEMPNTKCIGKFSNPLFYILYGLVLCLNSATVPFDYFNQ